MRMFVLLFILSGCVESAQEKIKKISSKTHFKSSQELSKEIVGVFDKVKNNYLVNRFPDYIHSTPQSIIYLLREDSYQGYYFVKNYIDESYEVKNFKNQLKLKVDNIKPSQMYKNTVMNRF